MGTSLFFSLRANANYTSGRGFDGLAGDATDVAYIFANDIIIYFYSPYL